MAAEFRGLGLSFMYPENWELSRDDDASLPHNVVVTSPTGAFWSISIDSLDNDDVMRQVVRAMHDEYEEVESEAISLRIGQQDVSGFELNFYCLDLLVTAQVVRLPSSRYSMVLLYQAESREFDKLRSVFDAISVSLVNQSSVNVG